MDFNNIKYPGLFSGQGTKGIISIIANTATTPYALSDANGTPLFVPYNVNNIDQQWYMVQDYRREAVALVNVKTGRWLYKTTGNSTMGLTATVTGTAYQGVAGPTNDFLFQLIMARVDSSVHLTPAASYSTFKVYGLRQFTSGTDYSLVSIRNTNLAASSWVLKCTDKAVDTARVNVRNTFCLPVLQFNTSTFIPVPFQPSAYHTISSLPGGMTRITRNATGITVPNHNTVLSSHAIADDLPNDSSILKVTFTGSSNCEIGWVSYEKINYNLTITQSGNGLRRPRVGLGMANGKIYFINDGDADTLPLFNTTNTISMGCLQGGIILKQNNNIYLKNGVALSAIFSNAAVGSRAELTCTTNPGGSVDVSYKPGSLLFARESVGSATVAGTTTNPDFALNISEPERSNTFEWRDNEYKLRYKSGGSVITEIAQSPFFSNLTAFSSIAHKYSASGTFISGADNSPYEGWEMIKQDFGYYADGTPKLSSELRNEPYMILYNRFTGVLRVFVYIANASIANNYRISLFNVNTTKYDAASSYKPPFLWNNVQEHRAMNDETVAMSGYAKSGPLLSSSSGQFYFSDFVMHYDPCVKYFESSIGVKVDKVTSGSMTLVGRTQGGVIPNNSPAVSTWLQHSNNYLTGVLNTPYGELSNTLGDITFQDYKNWGATGFRDEMQFVLPGRKVEDWERKAAQMTWAGLSLNAAGQFTQAAGSILTGTGEGMATAGAGLVDFGAPVRMSGWITAAAGQVVEASGTAIQADAARLAYEHLQDEPDQHIQIQAPDPRPSILFSELTAKGEVSISSPVLDNIRITTPGSRNASYAPPDYLNGSKGSFPLFNDQMGIFNLLYKPEFGLSVVKMVNGKYKATLRLKEHPYIAFNNILGIQLPVFSVAAAITTFKSSSKASTASFGTKSYPIPLSPLIVQDTSEKLRAEFDVTALIDWATIDSNCTVLSNTTDANIATQLSQWLEVSLLVRYQGFDAKLRNGRYGGSVSEAYFTGNTTGKYQSGVDASGNNPSAALATLNQNHFSNYTLSDNTAWGNTHIVFEGQSAFESRMQTFCQAANASKIVPPGTGGKPAADNNSRAQAELPVSIAASSRILVFPNPADGMVTVEYQTLSAGSISVQLYDFSGKKLAALNDYCTSANEVKKAEINLSPLSPGVYMIRIEFSNGEKYVVKVAKH